jgi:uncharacterized protein (DUF697 family)
MKNLEYTIRHAWSDWIMAALPLAFTLVAALTSICQIGICLTSPHYSVIPVVIFLAGTAFFASLLGVVAQRIFSLKRVHFKHGGEVELIRRKGLT